MKKTLFIDIGGVVLTNGWDRVARAEACRTFGLDQKELDNRHALMFDTYELGRISLLEYLKQVVFYTSRNFSEEQFIQFMYDQSKPYQETIDMLIEMKKAHGLKMVALSNEGRELTEYRIETFDLDRIFDFYVSSCFVGLKKPDKAIYRVGLDLAQARPQEAIYIEDRALFCDIGRSLGLNTIQHKDAKSTQEQLLQFFS